MTQLIVQRCAIEGCKRLTTTTVCERHRRPATTVSSAELLRRMREDRAECDPLYTPRDDGANE